MRLAGSSFTFRSTPSRRPLPRVAALGGVVAAISMLLIIVALSPASASAASALTVEVSPGLGLVGEAVTLKVGGLSADLAPGTKVVLRVLGPAEPSQVGQIDAQLPEAATVTADVGPSLPFQAGWDIVLGAASWTASTILPGDTLPLPGGYLVTAELLSGGGVEASGSAWFGKVASRERPLDLAFVLPVALGVHRDPTGAFFDQVLEEAVAGTGAATSGAPDAVAGGDTGADPNETPAEVPNDLRAVAGLAGRFVDWRFTLAVEPILLTQLRDMADGYVRLDSSGTVEQVGADDARAANAAQVLAAFADTADAETVEMAAGPYAGADLGALAAEGWRDGFEQIQLGKQELQQTLGLESSPVGAYSPDLDMTTESLAYYGQASVDHVVVDEQLANDLTEPLAEGSVAARVRDADNDRVTLVFTSSRLRSLMAPPWDPGVFFAGLAAELVAVPRDALVISLGGDFVLPPASYLDTIGESLTTAWWIDTHTLASLLREYTPETRPILLTRHVTGAQGYIEGAMLDSLRAAHAAVTDLAAAADPVEGPVEKAHRLLYAAESRWWWHPQTSPQVASIGLSYAEQALATAEAELDKVKLAGVGPTRIVGHEETIILTVDNGAGYPLEAEVLLSGEGVTFPDGGSFTVELEPGGNEVPVEVVIDESPHRLDVRLMAGSSVLDEGSQTLSSITLMTVLPWVVLAVVVLAVVVVAVVLLSRRRARA